MIEIPTLITQYSVKRESEEFSKKATGPQHNRQTDDRQTDITIA